MQECSILCQENILVLLLIKKKKRKHENISVQRNGWNFLIRVTDLPHERGKELTSFAVQVGTVQNA